MQGVWLPAAAAAVLILIPGPVRAQTGANVAVVINESDPASVRIGEHYAARRAVPASNVVRLTLPVADAISRADFTRLIEDPIRDALDEHGLHDQVLYIVLTKGIPLRINGTLGAAGTLASVDSELTLLYRRLIGRPTPPAGTVANPYFLGDRPIADARRFTHRSHDIYLVTRLDGFTVEDVIALIDRGVAPQSKGAIVLDQRMDAGSRLGDGWMLATAESLKKMPTPPEVVLDETRQPASSTSAVLGYYSWGSTDRALSTRAPALTFAPGAIAATLTSTDARTFTGPPADWAPAPAPADRRHLFAGSPDSLVGDLVRAGVTGAAGHVTEPLLRSAVRPQILFPAYLSGFNLAESFYLATPHLSWQAVVVGDPLCRPFHGADLEPADAAPEKDASTGLSPYFQERRIEGLVAANPGLSRPAAVLVLASEARRIRGDRSGAKEAARQAIALAPEQNALRLALATLHEQDNEDPEAVALYREVLSRQPRHVLALNNLAYQLSKADKGSAEALDMARRAYALAPGQPAIMDTLGWIEFQAGNKQEALRLLRAAAAKAPEHAEIRLHAAVVLADIGADREAREHLSAVLKLDASMATRQEVIALREKLGMR